MKIHQLLENIPHCQIYGATNTCVTGISANSKSMMPGNLFIAKKGITVDARLYVQEAVQAGASAVVSNVYDPTLSEVTQIIHLDIPYIEGLLASTFYRHPSQELFMVGITGTNGKTTTSFIIQNLLEILHGPCGLMGTIEYNLGKSRRPATHTTPEVINSHKMLREMCENGCTSAVMEVSSHALQQRRESGLDFDVGVFTNISQDHLDYHVSMDNYLQAKKLLFQRLGKERSAKQRNKWAIINRDSPHADFLLKDCSAQVLSYGIDSAADVRASEVVLTQEGTHAMVSYGHKCLPCDWPLMGRFNVYNCLAAMAVLLSQGISFEKVSEAMRQISPVPGRMQLVPNKLELKIYVDFAHSNDSLSNVLCTLQELLTPGGNLIVVFGCGGDRDKDKRPKMAQAVEQYAHHCIVTSDNPRSEDPFAICQQIIRGFQKNIYQIEVDRYQAIQKAIKLASPLDIVLIAGRGHENQQIFADKTIPFDDYCVIQEICQGFLMKKI